MQILIQDRDENAEELGRLASELAGFYARSSEYPAFQGPSQSSTWHKLFEPLVQELLCRHERIRVLEIGAGSTTYHDSIKRYRSRIEFHCQDVTARNEAYLRRVSDYIHFGELAGISGNGVFHLVFSTFVLEHVCRPRQFLCDVDRLLIPGGVHVVICPRYEMPGYFCPSLRHLPVLSSLRTHLFLVTSRLLSRLDSRPRFWVNSRPSVLSRPWFRDADAVHLVSRYDVEQWHKSRGYEVLRLNAPVSGLRDFIFKRFLVMSIGCIKRS